MTTQSIIFGYHENDTVNRKEAAIVRMIFYVYMVCELSHERIAFHLNRLGIACPGEAWTDLLVYEIGLTQLRACVPFLLVESHIRRRLDPSGIAGQPGE